MPQDGASLSGVSSVGALPPDPPHEKVAGLDQTGRETALQALPSEAKVARLLDAKPGPMTEQQRSACIADLETLNQAGFLKVFDPETMEYAKCGVAQALDSMSQGQPVFYSGSGREANTTTQIGDLEKLSAIARQAALGIVG